MAFALKPPDLPAARALAFAASLSTTVAQVLLHRGHTDAGRVRDFLSPKLKDLVNPERMKDRGIAADRLAHAVRSSSRIVVFGDYDVDGTTSAAILSGVLAALGGNVVTLLASRFDGGYGLSEKALVRVLDASPSLVVTCDCGSSDHERIRALRARGIDVIVVDHHLVPTEALPANAFLNPHRPECEFPYKHMTSAGLALSLAGAVRASLGAALDLKLWLDLVALGTIADVAPLDGDNRRLVRAGLGVLASPNVRPGIAALRDMAKMKPGLPIGAQDVAFRLSPRLNAAGRLGDPAITLQLLQATSVPSARAIAATIEQLNQERKTIEARVTTAAIQQAKDVYGNHPTSGIVVASPQWHRGVVGISAARLVEEFGVPVVVAAVEEGVAHGSARSPDGFPLYDALAFGRSEYVAFGGHQAAAGLSFRMERLDAVRAAFADGSVKLKPAVESVIPNAADVAIDGDAFSLPSVQELQQLEPVGEGNEEPTFVLPRLRVERATVVGGTHLKMTLRVAGTPLSAFGPNLGHRCPAPGSSIDALATLAADAWAGGNKLEMKLRDFA